MARSPFYWLDQLVRLNIVGSRVLPVIESKIKFVLPQVQLTFLWLDQHRRIINAYDSQVFKHARPHAQLQKLFSICDDANWMSFCSQLQSKQFKHTPVQHATGTDHCAAFLINYLPDPSYRESMVVGVLRNEQLAGILLLHRPEASPPFSSLEKQRAIELGNRLNLLLQPNAIHQESEIDSGEEGALFINRKLHPTYICDAAYKLLFLLNYSIVDKTTLAKLQEHHDICNYTINRHLHDVVPAVFESQKPSVKYLVSGWGKFRIQCNYMQLIKTESQNRHDFVMVKIDLLKPMVLIVPQRAEELSLSEREAEVCIHLIDNESYSDIGHRLNISKHTVSTHMKNIFTKLGVNNRHDLICVLRDHLNQEYSVL